MTKRSDESPFYKAVKSLVDEGKLRIIHIDGPPRTISSAFQVALTEGADGHLYEPFRWHRASRPLGTTCKDILKLYDEIKTKKEQDGASETQKEPGRADKPIVLIVKELSQFIDDDDFNKWLPLVGGWVSIVRSPNIQMQSFMTRCILDSDYFSPEEVKQTRDDLRLQTGGEEPFDSDVVFALSEKFQVKRWKSTPADVVLPHNLETSRFDMWGAAARHCEKAKEHGIPTAVVDGTVLCTDPESVMRRVTSVLHLPYSPKMVSGWKTASGKNLMHGRHVKDLKKDAWYQHAATSHEFSRPRNQPVPLSKFTPTVRKFTEQALRHFVDFANSPCAVLPRKSEEIEALFNTQVQEGTFFGMRETAHEKPIFKETQPIVAYAIALSMPAHGDKEESYKGQTLADLEGLHHEYYTDSFRIMRERQQAIEAAHPSGMLAPARDGVTVQKLSSNDGPGAYLG